MGVDSSINPAVMGSSKNSILRILPEIRLPSSSSLPPVLSRLISGKITLVMDSTRMPVIMVYRVLA